MNLSTANVLLKNICI